PCYLFSSSLPHRDLHSFPTRRSSDLSRIRQKRQRSYTALAWSNHQWLTQCQAKRCPACTGACRSSSSSHQSRSRRTCTERLELRSEEHTSELQSRFDLVCRLLLEKKK